MRAKETLLEAGRRPANIGGRTKLPECLSLPEIIEVVISFCAIIGKVGTAESVRRMNLSIRAISACFLNSMNSL